MTTPLALLVVASTFLRFHGGPRCIASLGDLDGDGRAEVAIASSFGGRAPGRVAIVSSKDGSFLREWRGEAKGHELGASIAVCGDVDGDGKLDLAIASPGIGHVDLVSTRTGERVRRILPPRLDDRFGHELASAGDVDGDGRVDLVVGAPGSGRAYVFASASGRELFAFAALSTATGSFGDSVAGGADVDGDGRPDFVVGAPSEGGSGRVHAYSGRDGHELWGSRAFHPPGEEFTNFGGRVALLGDLDGDGKSEVLVGADDLDHRGAAYVLAGTDGSRSRRLDGTDPGFACFGSSVAALGDVDGDGARDLVVGDPDDSDSPALGAGERGQALGSVHLVSGKTGVRIWVVFGDEAMDCLGACVASAGDVDGDAVDDVVARAGRLGDQAPYFRLYSGASGRTLREIAFAPE